MVSNGGNMNHTIENEKIKLTVAEHGAEIRSLIRKADGVEIMWQADTAYWGRTSPVLFPLVGNYYQKKSIYDGKTYEMGQHGFARDMDFTLVEKSDSALMFKLEDDASTHEKYPFGFILKIGYRLSGDSVEVSWHVENINDTRMYFSIGAHPAFNCNLDTDSIRFSKSGKPCTEIKANVIAGDGSGCLSEESDVYALTRGILKMSDELFAKDALIVEGHQADEVSLLDANLNEIVSVTCPTPLFGVWSPVNKHAPFMCIEPWYGRCDRVGFNQKLEEREYGNSLDAGEIFDSIYEIRIH